MPRALRGEQLGHTPAEFVAIVSARQDVEDAQREARQRKAFQNFQAELSAVPTLDSTAPTALQLEEGHQTKARQDAEDAQRRERSQTITYARRLAAMDAKDQQSQTIKASAAMAAMMDRGYGR